MELDNRAFRAEVKGLAESAMGPMAFSDIPHETGDPQEPESSEGSPLSYRHFTGTIDSTWCISSFSSLIPGQHYSAETPDRDAIAHEGSTDGEDLEGEEVSGIFSFPKGTGPGLFLHDLFEHLDFQEKDAAVVEGLVRERLQIHGFDNSWLGIIADLVHHTLSISLDPEIRGLHLSSIARQDRINEMEFYFPLKKVHPETLNNVFRENGCGSDIIDNYKSLESLRFAPVQGFMKGFMDMVFQYQDRFFLVDWKSNFLGPVIGNYDQASMRRAMVEAHYVLQYHIYTLALHQYLQVRVPGYEYERHFGGVFYIFLRGVNKDMGPDYGVFRDRPSLGLIQGLKEALIGG
jgi:exodeoxyribonuclease V beta subunit